MLINSNACVISDEMQIDDEINKEFDRIADETNKFLSSSTSDILKDAKRLLQIYLDSENIMLFLFNKMFKSKFCKRVKNKRKMFRLLDGFCKNFIKIDQKLYKSDFWCKYTTYKAKNNIETSENTKQETNQPLFEKLDIFSCISMPMGQLFSTFFYSKEIDLFYPTKLSKRTKIFLAENKIELLKKYYILAQEDDFIYLQTYLLLIIEIFTTKVVLKVGLSPALLDYVKIVAG